MRSNRFLHSLRRWGRLYADFGWRAPAVASPALYGVTGDCRKVRIPGRKEKCLIRPGTSDAWVLSQVFVHTEYELNMTSEPDFIIDAGANIGLTALFLAHRYPQARIVAIEPEESNFEILQRNVEHLSNVYPIKAALKGNSGHVQIVDPGDGAWGFRAGNVGGPREQIIGSASAITVVDVMDFFNAPRVNILKLDIEGSERDVMENACEWIDRVDLVIAELHDRFERGCSLSFYRATAAFEEEWHSGENVIVARKGVATRTERMAL